MVEFEFSEDESALRDNVRSVLHDLCPPGVVRACYEGEPATDVWKQMVALDWPALSIEERLGGLGMGAVEVAIVAEQLGRAVVPSPFLATVTQFVPAARELGGQSDVGERYLRLVASGSITGALALAEDGRWTADAVRCSARRDGDCWVLEGSKHAVMDGAAADEIVVVARSDSGLGAFVVPGLAIASTPRQVIDPTMPVADLAFDGVAVSADRVLAEPGSPDVERALARVVEHATVALAVATTGTCQVIFEKTVEYMKVREQYGRPIGSFQALKHRAVEMYLAVERATSVCYLAALHLADDTAERSLVAAAAKAAAGDAQRLVVQDGLQLHGGIGYTWENDLHFWLKRAKAGDAMFGNVAAQRAALARLLGLVGPDGEAAA